MTTDIIEINDFVVLIETTDSYEAEDMKCTLDDDVICITFYGSGNIEMEVNFGDKQQTVHSQKGMAFSFFGNKNVNLSRSISEPEPLKEISIFSTLKNIQQLPIHEKELYSNHLESLLSPKDDFQMGPHIQMTSEMQHVMAKIFNTPYKDTARLLFLKSQVLELLSHYFIQLSTNHKPEIKPEELDKIHQARDIIIQNIDKPPSLTELSKLIGMNNNKLKKNFKQIFGVPVFKYLQNQRLQKAYQLLNREKMTVQEVAWFVGYESLSSFSNAFYKNFGFRPSEVPK